MTDSLRKTLLCCRVSLLKSLSGAKHITIAAGILAFLGVHLSPLRDFSRAVGIGVAPWVFPYLFSPVMLVLYGVLTMLLFCDAPFFDEQTYFSMIRAGRFCWVSGQLLYIVLMSLIYTLFFWICSVIALIPNIEPSADWGKVLTTLAVEPGIALRYGYNVGISVSFTILDDFSAVGAAMLSVGLMWLNSSFLGTLIFVFNLVFRRFCGLFIAGFFVCVAYFEMYLGFYTVGNWLGYISPVSWVSMLYLNFNYPGVYYPSLAYAICCQVGALVIMGAVSVGVFCKRDVYEAERI